MARIFSLTAFVFALITLAMASPGRHTKFARRGKEATETFSYLTSFKTDASVMPQATYNSQGLPSDIFPTFTDTHLAETEENRDGLLYLYDQGNGVKLAN